MIPTNRELSRCGACGKPILWTLTEAAARMAVDPKPDERGNQACHRVGPRTWRSRSLDGADALPAAPYEHQYVPHVATCTPPKAKPPAELPPNVVRLDPRRRRRTRLP
ncbi:hypothetical protein [Nonomuraea soli]|uniref:Uncharacterized protein n=1 Tax=Nonomuraea soli TaxID=1032476 RepID=A0A7W0CNN6_9ACTN|nr:hypothetical protein [Nonomuraea soli]MBA2894450.1 hypothetical protein [Nonomuraea soli]